MTDKEIIFRALGLWKGYIETGVFGGMSKEHILEFAKGDKDMRRVAEELPKLTAEQQEFVEKLRSLQIRLLGSN